MPHSALLRCGAWFCVFILPVSLFSLCHLICMFLHVGGILLSIWADQLPKAGCPSADKT